MHNQMRRLAAGVFTADPPPRRPPRDVCDLGDREAHQLTGVWRREPRGAGASALEYPITRRKGVARDAPEEPGDDRRKVAAAAHKVGPRPREARGEPEDSQHAQEAAADEHGHLGRAEV